MGVVKKYGHMGCGFRVTTATDADLWAEMRRYKKVCGGGGQGGQTKVCWAKAYAEEGGKLTDCHEKENKRA